GVALQSPYEQQQSTTPPPAKRRTITSQILESIEFPDEFEVDGEEEEKFESIKFFGVSIVPFSEHLELWVELLWHFRAPDTDWAIADPQFCPAILGGGMPIYHANAKRGCVPQTGEEKVYFPLNEPKMHSALAELHIRTGIIILYDSMTPRKRNKDASIVENRTVVREYKITYQIEEKVLHQAVVYGDCRVWVCLLLYRLTHKLPVVFGDPLQVVIAYRKRMLAYF
ncbi:phospholipase-like protein, partial [Tanacetum coccineum]